MLNISYSQSKLYVFKVVKLDVRTDKTCFANKSYFKFFPRIKHYIYSYMNYYRVHLKGKIFIM